MENLYFNIPTVISHSYFTLSDETIHLSEKEINYFYSLLYLFRENMKDESKVKIFEKVGKKHSVSDSFQNITVRIELSQFDDLGVVSKNTYKDLKTFIKKLKNREMVINSLGKDKRLDIQPINMIEDFEIDDNLLYLTLDEDFLFLFLHTEKYFIKVDLNILFKISGYKSKKLYLLIKDYSQFKNQCIKITKENLENLISRIPSNNRFTKDIENVNEIIYEEKNISDINIDYPNVIGRKLKKYEFKFKDLVKKEKEKSTKSTKPKEEIPSDIKNEVDKRIDNEIKRGKIIKNIDGYKQKSYKNENDKLKPKPIGDIENIEWLEDFVNSKIVSLKEMNEINYSKFSYFCFYHKNNLFPLHIDNNYCIHHKYGDITTSNVDETVENLKYWLKNKEIDGIDGFNIITYNKKYEDSNIEVFRVIEE